MRVYAKNSFDRFSDDLTELILSYLTLEDKIRLECLSKQCRRLVFNKQFCLGMKDNELKYPLTKLIRITNNFDAVIDPKDFVSVLKKCPNVNTFCLNLKIQSRILSLIGRHCQHIKSLKFYSKGDKYLNFVRKYGHRLEDIGVYVQITIAKRRRHFFGQILEINVNLTGFSLNLVKLTLI